MYSSDSFAGAIVVFGIICAVGGWAVIEVVLWLLSYVHISIG